MSCIIHPKESFATLNLGVGGYRVRLLGPETVQVEALKDDGTWVVSRFPPWSFIIEELHAYLAARALHDALAKVEPPPASTDEDVAHLFANREKCY